MTESATESIADHREFLRGFLRRLVRDDELAEDLAQEVFLRAQRALADFRGQASLRSWLCTIALNAVRDNARGAARRPAAPTEPSSVDSLPAPYNLERDIMESEMTSCIDDYVAELPGQHHDVVVLHDIAELPHSEIACLLGISEANSRVLLHRGRALLREKLDANCKLSFDDESAPCEPRRPRGKC